MLRSGFATRGLDPDTAIDALAPTIPLGGVAEPADIGDAIACLACVHARYVSGTLLDLSCAKVPR